MDRGNAQSDNLLHAVVRDVRDLSFSLSHPPSLCGGGALGSQIRPVFAAICVEGLSAPPFRSAGVFQPLLCGKDTIRLSYTLHSLASSGKPAGPRF